MLPTLIDSNTFSATVTVLGKDRVKTVEAIWLCIFHDVSHPTELARAFHTCKMMHVPSRALSFSTFIREDYL